MKKTYAIFVALGLLAGGTFAYAAAAAKVR